MAHQARLVVTVVVALCVAACAAPPDPSPSQPPASTPSNPIATPMTEEAALRIAFDMANFHEDAAEVSFRHLTTWAEVPMIGGETGLAPSSGEHPVWFIGIGVPGGPSGGASFLVILDAIDGHAIQTQRATS